jgi:hypothetical protein
MSKLYGVIEGVYYNGFERTEELSKRMYERNVPSKTLQPQYGIRAVSTKYDLMPILERHTDPASTIKIKKEPVYNIEQTFNPGTSQAPWSGFASNINNESRLRNQFFALQSSCQSAYIPSSTSDMYDVQINSGLYVHQPFPDLFSTPQLEQFNPNSYNIGKNTFENCTRQQLKTV